MALKHIISIGSMIAAFLSLITPASGQLFKPGPRFDHRAVETPAATRPFATPGVFDYDMQMFAPVDFTNNEQMNMRCGYYASIDRLYSSFSKSGNFSGINGAQISSGSNYIWGNRFEFGWLNTSDDGIGLVFQHQNGSNFTNGQDELVSNPMLVKSFFADAEINRIFRQCLKSGGYFEPFIGFRFINVTDTTLEDTLQTVTVAGVTAARPNRFKQDVKNNLFGAHAGGRYVMHQGRWKTSAKGALATTYNRQNYFATDILTTPAGVGITEFYDADSSFAPVLDLQFDVAFFLTRDISLKMGVQTMYLWDGISRANTMTTSVNPNSAFGLAPLGPQGIFEDSLVNAGFLFGLEWRR